MFLQNLFLLWSVDRGAHIKAFTFSSQDHGRLPAVHVSKQSCVWCVCNVCNVCVVVVSGVLCACSVVCVCVLVCVLVCAVWCMC